MADAFGGLALPVPIPATDAPLADPALATILSFIQAVLDFQVTAAWGARSPGGVVNKAARYTATHDPREGVINSNKLPGLFLYRAQVEEVGLCAADLPVTTELLRLDWVFPLHTQAKDRLRGTVINGLLKALVVACEQGRHPAWTVATDDADPDAIKTTVATSTSAQSYSGAALNGAVGGDTVHAARPVTVTTAAAVGAYNTTDPIVFAGTLFNGNAFEESVLLTNANGGETVAGLWNLSDVTSIDVPAQLLATGSLTFGYGASPEKAYGAPVRRYAGLSQLRCSGARKVRLVIPVGSGDERKEDFDSFQFDLHIQELFAPDVAAANGVLGQIDSVGADITYSYPDDGGDAFATASLS